MFKGANRLRFFQWYRRASSLRRSRSSRSRVMREGVAPPQRRCRIALMPWWICGTVIAGVHFFSPPGFRHQEPRCDERKRLMMMPAFPVANLVVGKPGFALAASNALFDAMFRFGHASEIRQRRIRRGVRQVVVRLDHFGVVAIAVSDNYEHFFVAFLATVRAPHDTPPDGSDDQVAPSSRHARQSRSTRLRRATPPTHRRVATVASVADHDRRRAARGHRGLGSTCCWARPTDSVPPGGPNAGEMHKVGPVRRRRQSTRAATFRRVRPTFPGTTDTASGDVGAPWAHPPFRSVPCPGSTLWEDKSRVSTKACSRLET